jgi:hypothetical protein
VKLTVESARTPSPRPDEVPPKKGDLFGGGKLAVVGDLAGPGERETESVQHGGREERAPHKVHHHDELGELKRDAGGKGPSEERT